MGAPGRTRPGPAPRPDDRGAAAAEAARAQNLRATARQRDPEEGGRIFRPGGARPPSEVRWCASSRPTETRTGDAASASRGIARDEPGRAGLAGAMSPGPNGLAV